MPANEPSRNDLSPLIPADVTREREPAFLIDTSGSENWGAKEGHDHPKRKDVMGEAMGIIVARMEKEDSQAEAEAAAGEDAGGVMTVIFSDPESAEVIGDLSSANWKAKWDNISWGGGTYIMPGFRLVVDNFMSEFGSKPKEERPVLDLFVMTDGEADDMVDFERECANAHGDIYITVGITGYGDAHDKTLAAYDTLSKSNPHIRALSWESVTDPNLIADEVMAVKA